MAHREAKPRDSKQLQPSPHEQSESGIPPPGMGTKTRAEPTCKVDGINGKIYTLVMRQKDGSCDTKNLGSELDGTPVTVTDQGSKPAPPLRLG